MLKSCICKTEGILHDVQLYAKLNNRRVSLAAKSIECYSIWNMDSADFDRIEAA